MCFSSEKDDPSVRVGLCSTQLERGIPGGRDVLDVGCIVQSGSELSRENGVARVSEVSELEDLRACRAGL